MQSQRKQLRDGRVILIREAQVEDARSILDFVELVGGESDFLSFGPGEFGGTEAKKGNDLRRHRDTDNHLHILGLIENTIAGSLSFSAGHRPRVRHTGEFGMSVLKEYWGLGIGSLMLDVLIDWARKSGIVKKINLRVRSDNQRAVHLYERKGFVHEGTISREIVLDGTYFNRHWMGLEL